MSEREPKPEKMKDECLHCGGKYTLKPDNAMLITYPKKPECNHLNTKCPHCGGQSRIFIVGEHTVNQARENNLTIGELEWPSDEVYQGFCNVYEIELIEPRTLTPRQETHPMWLGWLLENEYLTAEDFEQEIIL